MIKLLHPIFVINIFFFIIFWDCSIIFFILIIGFEDKKDIFNNFIDDDLKFYIKYTNNKKFILRFYNMFENKNITINYPKLNLTEMGLNGIFTLNQTQERKLVWQDKN